MSEIQSGGGKSPDGSDLVSLSCTGFIQVRSKRAKSVKLFHKSLRVSAFYIQLTNQFAIGLEYLVSNSIDVFTNHTVIRSRITLSKTLQHLKLNSQSFYFS